MAFSAISDRDWWVLGADDCRRDGTLCRATIIYNTDAGGEFSALPVPSRDIEGLADGRPLPGIDLIAFANRLDGWVAGSGLWSTVDGGEQWERTATPGPVDELVAGGGYVYAIVDTRTPQREGAPAELWRSPIDRDAWGRLSSAGDVSEGLAVHGSEVIVQSAETTGALYALGPDMLVSRDDGEHFTATRAPGPDSFNAFAPTSPTVTWALSSGGHFEFVSRSTSTGTHFTDVTPGRAAGRSGPPNGTPFATASSTTAVLAVGPDSQSGPSLYRTTDAGRRWVKTGPSGLDWAYLGFTDATHGVGIAGTGESTGSAALYRTSDGGSSYLRVAIP